MKLLLLLALAGSAHAGPIKVPPKRSKVVVYEQLTVAQAQAMLARRGVATEVLTSPQATGLRFEVAELTIYLTLIDGGTGTATEVFGYTLFELAQPVSLERVNQWNAKARHSRAYLNEQGVAVLECDLRLRGGVTDSSLDDFVDTLARAADGFSRHIGFR